MTTGPQSKSFWIVLGVHMSFSSSTSPPLVEGDAMLHNIAQPGVIIPVPALS